VAAVHLKVLLLDELVNGRDPQGIRWVRGLLRSLASEGRAVLVSSHLITETATTADHLVVIGQGRLLADTTVAELASRRFLPRRGIHSSSSTVAPSTRQEACDAHVHEDRPSGRYQFPHVVHMEWIKLRSLPSTWCTLALAVAASTGIAVAAGPEHASRSIATSLFINGSLIGMLIGVLLSGVLGVLVMTGEYTSGTILATLAAVPRRPLILAAKAAVYGVVALVTGEAAASLSFLLGRIALGHGITAPTLAEAGVLRAVVLTGVPNISPYVHIEIKEVMPVIS
jgi:hypothetical protein